MISLPGQPLAVFGTVAYLAALMAAVFKAQQSVIKQRHESMTTKPLNIRELPLRVEHLTNLANKQS